jgi:hypothetical protein
MALPTLKSTLPTPSAPVMSHLDVTDSILRRTFSLYFFLNWVMYGWTFWRERLRLGQIAKSGTAGKIRWKNSAKANQFDAEKTFGF